MLNVTRSHVLLLTMATNRVLLAFFTCHCRGVKFYDLAEVGARQGSKVRFVRDPGNPCDTNCVEVWLCEDGRRQKLGYVAKEAAECLSPMLKWFGSEKNRWVVKNSKYSSIASARTRSRSKI